MVEESALRSVYKAMSWRILATLTTALVVYLITGSTEFAVTIGLIEGIAKIGLYYFHERLWNRLNIGRRPGDHRADVATDPTPAARGATPRGTEASDAPG